MKERKREREGEIALIVYAHFMYWRRVDQFGFTCATNGFFLAPGSRGFDRLQVGEVMSLAHHSQGVTLQLLPTQTKPLISLDWGHMGSHSILICLDFLLAMAVDVELFSYERESGWNRWFSPSRDEKTKNSGVVVVCMVHQLERRWRGHLASMGCLEALDFKVCHNMFH